VWTPSKKKAAQRRSGVNMSRLHPQLLSNKWTKQQGADSSWQASEGGGQASPGWSAASAAAVPKGARSGKAPPRCSFELKDGSWVSEWWHAADGAEAEETEEETSGLVAKLSRGWVRVSPAAAAGWWNAEMRRGAEFVAVGAYNTDEAIALAKEAGCAGSRSEAARRKRRQRDEQAPQRQRCTGPLSPLAGVVQWKHNALERAYEQCVEPSGPEQELIGQRLYLPAGGERL
jgi:hypothetical protein